MSGSGNWVRVASVADLADGESIAVDVGDLNLAHVSSRDLSWVRIRGKGNKLRHCPLWTQTVNEIIPAVTEVWCPHLRHSSRIERTGQY